MLIVESRKHTRICIEYQDNHTIALRSCKVGPEDVGSTLLLTNCRCGLFNLLVSVSLVSKMGL